jgi:hypothetical protein
MVEVCCADGSKEWVSQEELEAAGAILDREQKKMPTKYKVVYADWEMMDRDQRWAVMGLEARFLSDRPDLYYAVYESKTSSPFEKEADLIFKRFNIGDFGDRKDIRSMSVGDLVVFEDGSALLCLSFGWKPVCIPSEFIANLERR